MPYSRGSVHLNENISELINPRYYDTWSVWVKLVDVTKLCLTPELKKDLQNLIRSGKLEIVTSPSLSSDGIDKNRCAKVVDVYDDGDYIMAKLRPEGHKKRIFTQMIDDNNPIVITLCGSGEYIYVPSPNQEQTRLQLNQLKYIRLGFTR